MEALDKPEILQDRERFRELVAARLGGGAGPFLEKLRRVRESRGGEKKWWASGVLLPLEFDRQSGEHIAILNKRSADVQQAGDLCLPGGGIDPGKDRLLARLLGRGIYPFNRSDPFHLLVSSGKEEKKAVRFILAGALRECWEEMRLNPWNVEFLGTLPVHQLQSYPSVIFPVVGRILRRWRPRPNWEVEKIIRVPLRAFWDPGNYVYYRLNISEDMRKLSGLEYWEMPGLLIPHDGEEEVLWGATFRILLNFMQRALDLAPERIHPVRRIERNLPYNYITGKRQR